MRLPAKLIVPASLLLAILLLPATAARAQQNVRITGGQVTIPYISGRGFRSVQGNIEGDGFRMAFVQPDGGSHANMGQCTDFPCAPGASINLTGGTVRLSNVPTGDSRVSLFQNQSGAYNFFFVNAQFGLFARSFVLPQDSPANSEITLNTPFALGGLMTVDVITDSAGTRAKAIDGNAGGRGVLSATYRREAAGYRLVRYTFKFQRETSLRDLLRWWQAGKARQ